MPSKSKSESSTPSKKTAEVVWTMQAYDKQVKDAKDLSETEWANFYVWASKVQAGKHPKIAAEEAGDMDYNCLSKFIGHYEVCLSETHRVSFFQNDRNHIIAIHQIGGLDQQLKLMQIQCTMSSKSNFTTKSKSPPPPKEKAETVWTMEAFAKQANKAKDLNEVDWANFCTWASKVKAGKHPKIAADEASEMDYHCLSKVIGQYEVCLNEINRVSFFQNNRNHTVAIHQIGGIDQQFKRTQIERTISSKSKSKSKSVSKSKSPIPRKKAEAGLWTTEEATKEPNTGTLADKTSHGHAS